MEGLAALGAFESLRRRYRPQPHEWTVLAAVVATGSALPDPRGTVVSLATGTKCIGPAKMSARGEALNDCHAEVLARRGLRDFLAAEVALALAAGEDGGALPPEALIERSDASPAPATPPAFRLREDVQLHLFVSELPCGDCSLVPEGDQGLRFSGAKPVLEPTAREAHQEVGIVRRKSGRHDLEPGQQSLSLSCSDKIARWTAFGLQGKLLSRWLPDPVHLRSIVLSLDCLEPVPATRQVAQAALDGLVASSPAPPDPQLCLGSVQRSGVALQLPEDVQFAPAAVRACLEACWRGAFGRVMDCLDAESAPEMQVRLALCAFPYSSRRVQDNATADGVDEAAQSSSESAQRRRKRKRKRGLSSAGLSVHWTWTPSRHQQQNQQQQQQQQPRVESVRCLNGATLEGVADHINQATGRIAGLKPRRGPAADWRTGLPRSCKALALARHLAARAQEPPQQPRSGAAALRDTPYADLKRSASSSRAAPPAALAPLASQWAALKASSAAQRCDSFTLAALELPRPGSS